MSKGPEEFWIRGFWLYPSGTDPPSNDRIIMQYDAATANIHMEECTWKEDSGVEDLEDLVRQLNIVIHAIKNKPSNDPRFEGITPIDKKGM